MWPAAHSRTENTRKTPKIHLKKGHKMVKNQNFEKLLKKCLDIENLDLKIIFSKHYVPMQKTIYSLLKVKGAYKYWNNPVTLIVILISILTHQMKATFQQCRKCHHAPYLLMDFQN